MVEPKGMVFKNEHETNGEKWYSYSFSVSSKNQNDEWKSASCPIRFRKGVDVPNKTRIKITDGWQRPFKFKDGYVLGWFANDFEIISGKTGFTALTDEEVPF